MATFDEFWGRMGPGLFELGTGIYNRRSARKEGEQRLRAAQGPLFQRATSGATGMLDQIAGLDPDALAGQRFAAQEELLRGPQEKDLADLQRMLHARGQLGIANYNPGVEGITPDGTAMNPQMAAFFAARNADRSRRAAGALDEGQKFASGMLDRAGRFSDIAGGAQERGLRAQDPTRPGGIPSRSVGNAEILRGVGGMIMKDPQILKDIWEFGSGMLGDLFGGNSWGDLDISFPW